MGQLEQNNLIIKALGYSPNLLCSRQSEINTLFQNLEANIISSDDVSEQLSLMTKKEVILNRQATFCGIWRATDGRYKTKIPTSDGNKKLIAKSSLSDLENQIIEHYKQLEQIPNKPCMRSIYPEWINYKSQETSFANACSIQSRWARYFENSSIVDVPFENLTTGSLKTWCVNAIKEMDLTDRQFKDLKTIMNMLFDYAVSYNIIQINLSRQVRGFSKRIFKEENPKPVSEIIYDVNTKHSVIENAVKQFYKTQNIAYIAVCLNFSLGLRVGELVALRTSHINTDGTITICQEETKTYYKDSTGKIHRHGYEIVNHTKTLSGNRILILTPKAMEYINIALEYNREHSLKDDDFIFLDKNGHRIHDHAVNNIIRRLNGTRNEKDNFIIDGRPSGNHSIRRTAISELHNAMVISDDTLKSFAGHKDISTTQKCYIHQNKPIIEYRDAFEKVLDS